MRILVLFAVAATCCFAQNKSDYWAKTDLKISLVRNIISDKNCRSSFPHFLACVSAINFYYGRGKPVHFLIPETVAKNSPQVKLIYKKSEIEGILIVEKKEIDISGFKTRTEMRKAIFEDRERIEKEWEKMYIRQKGNVVRWNGMMDDFEKFFEEVKKPDEEAEAVSLLFNGYYAVADGPHARIETVKQIEDLHDQTAKDPLITSTKDGVLYLKLPNFFDPKLYSDMEIALNKPEKTRPKKVILDLRNNLGGHLYLAVQIASLFLPKGTLVANARKVHRIGDPDFFISLGDLGNFANRMPPLLTVGQYYSDMTSENEPALTTTLRDPLFTGPMAILINEKSTSGSEVLAGAFRATKVDGKPRALLVGTRTFGKGTVITSLPWVHDEKIRHRQTTAIFFSSDGQTPHVRGVAPDIFAGPHPRDTEDSMVVQRAEELYEHNIPWNLPEEIKPSAYIKDVVACVERHGEEKKNFLNAERRKVKTGDYPLGVALDALDCPRKYELAPMPRLVEEPEKKNVPQKPKPETKDDSEKEKPKESPKEVPKVIPKTEDPPSA